MGRANARHAVAGANDDLAQPRGVLHSAVAGQHAGDRGGAEVAVVRVVRREEPEGLRWGRQQGEALAPLQRDEEVARPEG